MKRRTRSFLALALALPATAVAQPIGSTTTGPDAPTNLDPGRGGNQGPATAPAPATQAPSRPGIVVVGPDGKIVESDAPEPRGYFVPTDSGDPYQAPDSLHNGPLPELHVVRRGDTLWDLCFFYFNDPWQWPKIWSYNAQITNPHWIYPGDLVRLLPRGVFATTTGPRDPDTGKRPPDLVPAPAQRSDASVTSTAFVEKSDLDRSVTIAGAVDEKELLGTFDEVYLTYPKNAPPTVGERYSIYVPGKAVEHDGKRYGAYVRLLGTLEVRSVKDGKRARGVIVEANHEIERGAKVGPLVTKFKTVPPVAAEVDLQGTIVAMLSKDQLIGERGEIVFIDKGKASGLLVGNRMFVVRRGDGRPALMSTQIGADDRRYPARALGEIMVVEVGDKVSIGVVTAGVQEMAIGDLVMMQTQK